MCVFGIKALFYQDNDYRNFTETLIKKTVTPAYWLYDVTVKQQTILKEY